MTTVGRRTCSDSSGLEPHCYHTGYFVDTAVLHGFIREHDAYSRINSKHIRELSRVRRPHPRIKPWMGSQVLSLIDSPGLAQVLSLIAVDTLGR